MFKATSYSYWNYVRKSFCSIYLSASQWRETIGIIEQAFPGPDRNSIIMNSFGESTTLI